MGVSVTLAPLISADKLKQFFRVDCLVNMGEVSADVMTPELSALEFADRVAELIPRRSPCAFCDLLPMDILGSAFGIASLVEKGAGCGASALLAGTCRDRARLAVA